ncbi:toxic anion resistance protein [Azospira sp. I09]|uniref:toxic anion resistance protein n=1 Tax=Azospira sp. I09 TaxID=1765049 RepID=UPI001260607E|nr:toxic anion resistance protein [Azospira sp. I09]BBN90578.1 hypothetical protein AZSP09_36010 [Azospira sp. I09]
MTEQVTEHIDLSKYSDEDRAAIEAMQEEINLASTVAITNFCNVSSASAGIEALSSAMEQAPTSLLAGKIAEIVAKLSEADPRIVAEKPGWLARVTGSALEGKVRYQVSRKAVDTLIEEADRLSEHVVSLVGKLEEMMAAHAKESRQLELKMVAGKLYLERNPDAGLPPAGEIAFDNPRERFARRLASMAALFSSNEMSLTQMKLTRAQAIDMVERFHEISSVLVPVWRQHTMALVSSIKNSPEAITVAAKAHESLMTSLSALKGSAR